MPTDIVEKKPNSIEEIRQFFLRKNMYKVLKSTLSMLLSGKPVDFILNESGDSYTNMNVLVVGLSKIFHKLTYEEIYIILLALLGHESQHVLSTNLEEYIEYIKEKTTDLEVKGISSVFAENIITFIGNVVEDGRIENILINNYPGYIPKIQFLNIYMWQKNEEKKKIEQKNEIDVLMSGIWSLSKLGIYPKNYEKYFLGSKVDRELNKIKDLIKKAIGARTSKECFIICREIVDLLTPFLLEKYKDIKKEEELMNEMMEMLRKMMGEMTNDNNFYNNKELGPEQENNKQNYSSHITSQNNKKEDSEEKRLSQPSQSSSNKKKDDNPDNKKDELSSSNTKEEKSIPNEEKTDTSNSENSKEEKNNSDEEKTDTSNSENSKEEKNDSNDKEESLSANGSSNSSSSDEKTEESNSDDKKDDSDSENFKEEKNGDCKKSEDNGNQSLENNDNDDSENSDIKKETYNLSNGVNTVDNDNKSALSEDEISEKMKEITDELTDEINDTFSKVNKLEKENAEIKDEPALNQKEMKEILTISPGYERDFTEIPSNFSLDHNLPTKLKTSSKKFRKEIEKIFKNKSTLNLHSQEKGVINTEELYKVGLKDYNIFTIEGSKNNSDYVAYILQDGSGSMSGDKEMNSAYALSIIEEGLKGIIPFKLTTFSASSEIKHYVIKNWNDKSKRNYSYNFLRHRPAGGGNEDDISIKIATKELLKRPERDKILIVLSDGLPSNIKRTKEAIKEARAKKIYLVGIMFGSETFRKSNYSIYKEMYQKNIIATEPKKIPYKLTETLKKILTGI